MLGHVVEFGVNPASAGRAKTISPSLTVFAAPGGVRTNEEFFFGTSKATVRDFQTKERWPVTCSFYNLLGKDAFCSSGREMLFSVGRVRVSFGVHFLAYYIENSIATRNFSDTAKMSSQRYLS